MHATPDNDAVTDGSRLERLAKFGVVGASSLAVNVAAFAALRPALWFLPAAALSWLLANVACYDLNRRFTFDEAETGYLRGLVRHFSVYAVGFLTYGAALIAVGGLVDGVAAIGLASALGGVTNFVGSELWVFDP